MDKEIAKEWKLYGNAPAKPELCTYYVINSSGFLYRFKKLEEEGPKTARPPFRHSTIYPIKDKGEYKSLAEATVAKFWEVYYEDPERYEETTEACKSALPLCNGVLVDAFYAKDTSCTFIPDKYRDSSTFDFSNVIEEEEEEDLSKLQCLPGSKRIRAEYALYWLTPENVRYKGLRSKHTMPEGCTPYPNAKALENAWKARKQVSSYALKTYPEPVAEYKDKPSPQLELELEPSIDYKDKYLTALETNIELRETITNLRQEILLLKSVIEVN